MTFPVSETSSRETVELSGLDAKLTLQYTGFLLFSPESQEGQGFEALAGTW